MFSGDELDIFFIYLQLETDIVPPDIPPSEPISADNIKAQLHQLEDMIAIQLELMSIFESLKWISALPTFSGQGKWPSGMLGIWGEWLFIFRELGSTGDYFQGFGDQAHSFGDLGRPAKK